MIFFLFISFLFVPSVYLSYIHSFWGRFVDWVVTIQVLCIRRLGSVNFLKNGVDCYEMLVSSAGLESVCCGDSDTSQ